MIRFLAFGAPELAGDDAAELRSVLTQPRLLALLAYLVIARPRGFRRRDTLLALLWPERTADAARNALRQVVHRLRRALGEDVVMSRGADELGIAHEKLWSDVVAFEDALDAGRPQEALALYRGDLLPGFFTSGAPEFERWLDEERTRLRRRAAAAGWAVAEAETQAGTATHAVMWARWAAALTPDDEAAHRKLIELQLRLGDRAGALSAYEALARRLADDFGTSPSPETRKLVEGLNGAVDVPRPPRISDEPLPPWPAAATPGQSPRVARWRQAIVVAAALVLFVALGLVAAGNRAAVDGARTLAVFPFAVRGSEDFQYLREGMVDLLSAKIEGGPGFDAIDPRTVVAAGAHLGDAPSLETQAGIARRLGASWLLSGEVLEIAGRLHISATLYDVSRGSRAVANASVSGEGTGLFQLVDDLVGRILATAMPGRDSALTSLAGQTTHSLPALKMFLAGERALRAGRETEAAAAFREATAIDSTFALAQYRLAITATWAPIGEVPDAAQRMAIASRHATRLAPIGRDLIRAYQAYKDIRIDTAEAIYREVTRAHPDNVEAWLMLGETGFHYNPLLGRSLHDARVAFDRVLQLDPGNLHALLHLARLTALEGKSRSLDSLARSFVSHYSDAQRLLEVRALVAYAGDDRVAQRAVAVQARDADDFTKQALLQAAVLYAQNFAAAGDLADVFRNSVSNPQAMRYMGRLLQELPMAAGRWRDARPESVSPEPSERDWLLETQILLATEPALGIPEAAVRALRDSLSTRRSFPTIGAPIQPVRSGGPGIRSYLLGLLSARLGDSVATKRHLRELTSHNRDPLAQGLGRSLRAEILRSAGDVGGALAELDAFPFNSTEGLYTFGHWGYRERFLKAELLVALGREREALSWYDCVVNYSPWLAMSHLRMGEIESRLGNRDAARFHLRRFTTQWRDADPGLQPLVKRGSDALNALSH